MKDLLVKAAETIQRLGTAAQDCKSCARLPLCNAYKDGNTFKGCDYKWIYSDKIENIQTFGGNSNSSDWYE
jgi:hypothetical protein